MKRLLLLATAAALILAAAASAETFTGTATGQRPFTATFSTDGTGAVSATATFTPTRGQNYVLSIADSNYVNPCLTLSDPGATSVTCNAGVLAAGTYTVMFQPTKKGNGQPTSVTVTVTN